MSLITKYSRISVKPFAAVPALGDLPEIQRPSATVSNLSSARGIGEGVDLAEGCILTKSIKFTHQLAHWVNAVRGGDARAVEDIIESELCVIPYDDFSLNDACNLAYFEAFLHTSLDLYAFVAITASFPILNNLIELVNSDNDRRQREADERGNAGNRLLNFIHPSFADPEYELVALHPDHFLPNGAILTIYDSATGTPKHYVPANDQRLRTSRDPTSPRLPPFRHSSAHRDFRSRLNVFLVILNAEIKFHRYFEMIRVNPPQIPLPTDVLALMRLTIELVNLLYWKPVPRKGSPGEAFLAALKANERLNPARSTRSDPTKTIVRASSEEMEMRREDGGYTQHRSRETSGRRRRFHWPADMDLEARQSYGRALMSGHDRDYDPALFEDAFPIDDDFYSDDEAVEAWNHSVASRH